MTAPRKYAADAKAAKALAQALTTLPENWVMCRDMRHAWSVEVDFHVVPQTTEGKATHRVQRDLICMRCETIRHEYYIKGRYGLDKDGQSYSYPHGYQFSAMGIPRGVKPSSIIQQEQYRRAMEKVANAAAGERETSEH